MATAVLGREKLSIRFMFPLPPFPPVAVQEKARLRFIEDC